MKLDLDALERELETPQYKSRLVGLEEYLPPLIQRLREAESKVGDLEALNDIMREGSKKDRARIAHLEKLYEASLLATDEAVSKLETEFRRGRQVERFGDRG